MRETTKRTVSNLLNFLIPMYFFGGTLIGMTYFDIFHPICLSSLGLFLMYYYLKFISDFRVNRFLFIFIMFHIAIGLFYSNIWDYVTVILYLVVVFAFSLAAKFDSKIYDKFSIAVVLTNYMNAAFLILSPASRTRYKTIGGLSIQINYFEDVHFSIAALTALLAIILVFKINLKGFKGIALKLTTILLGLFNIFTLGKVSILLGLFVSIIIARFFFFKGNASKITKLISTVIMAFTFVSGWILGILVEVTKGWGINYTLFTGQRNIIWGKYLDFFSREPIVKKLIGAFLIRTYNDIVQQGLPHPHNQWITILISTGIIGLIFYFILLKKAYNYAIMSGDRIGFACILALNMYATTDDYVFLTAGCMNAFLLFYFAIQKRQRTVYVSNEESEITA